MWALGTMVAMYISMTNTQRQKLVEAAKEIIKMSLEDREFQNAVISFAEADLDPQTAGQDATDICYKLLATLKVTVE